MSEDKWRRHKGILTFKIGDDEFTMKPTIDHVAEYFSKIKARFGKIDPSVLNEYQAEILKIAKEVSVKAMKEANPEISEEVIKEFVENNSIIVTQTFLSAVEK